MDEPLHRRTVLRALGAVGAAGVAGCSVGLGQSNGFEPGERDWPSLGFDAHNNGVHPSAPGPGGDLAVAWTAPYRDDWANKRGVRAVSSPVVLDGTVVGAADVRQSDGDETVVSAFDLASGERQWTRSFPRQDLGAEASRTLGSDGERLVLATNDGGWTLRALSPADGEPEWEHSLDGPTKAPITCDSESLFVGTESVTAYDPADGSRRRRYLTDDDRGWAYTYPVTADEDTVYATVRDEVHAIDRESGETRWTAASGFDSIWNDDFGAPFTGTVLADGVLYATCGRLVDRDGGGLVAISTDDGSVLLSAIPDGDPTPDGQGRGHAEAEAAFYLMPLVLDGTVYAHGREEGDWGFFAVDAADGSVERLGDEGWLSDLSSVPVAADGTLYGASGGEELTVSAVDPSSGETLGSATVTTWGSVGTGPGAIAGEHFVVGTNEGLVAVGPT